MKKVILLVTVLFLATNMLTAQVPADVAKLNRAQGLAMTLPFDYPINFTPKTAEMDAASKANLGKMVEQFKKFPNGTIIEIAANTTDLGSNQLNLDLTDKRATAVKDALIALGVNPKALTARGYGNQRPALKPDKSETARLVNTYLLYSVSQQSFKEDFEVVTNSSSLPKKEIESSIKELMEISGLSREELGKRAAESHKDIQSWEKSKQSTANSNATPPALLNDDHIYLNKGWRKVVLGASEQEINNALGKPVFTFTDILDDPKNVSRYDKQGIIVWFKKEKEWKAVKILFFAGAKLDQTDNTESYMVNGSKLTIKIEKVPFTPEKVAWWVSVGQVVAAYGKPDSQSNFDLFGTPVTLLKYGETNFYFRRNELYQIALISQNY